MTLIRWILGRIILLFNALFSPESPVRTPEKQAYLDQRTANLSLYQLPTCPFCVKVRRAIKRNGLNIELRDTSWGSPFRAELLERGGRSMVPCLRIDEGNQSVWLYESSDIVAYLENQIVGKTEKAA